MPLSRRTTARTRRLAGTLRAAAVVPALALGGCYSYRATDLAPRPGADVRIELTAEGTSALARYLGPRVTALDGRVHSWGPDSTLLVAVSTVRNASGAREPWVGEAPVQLARSHVESVGLRTLARGRSWATGVTTAAVLAAVGVAAVRGSRGKDGGDGEPPPPPPP